MLYIYTIYDHPRDHPEHFVIRRRLIDKSGNPNNIDFNYLQKTNNLQEARALIPPDLVRLPREAADDPVIVESYI